MFAKLSHSRPASNAWNWLPIVGCGAVLLLLGCRPSPYPLAPARGSVTIEGQPLVHAKVMFSPVSQGPSMESGRSAMGRLQADGSFTLSTYQENDGAIVGEHMVTVISLEKPRNTADSPRGAQESTSTGSKSIPKFSRIVLPTRLRVSADQENHFSIALTRQQILQFAQVD